MESKKHEFSPLEYQSLREEILQRTNGIEPQISTVIVTMLSAWAVGLTLTEKENLTANASILISFVRTVIFVVPIFYSLPLAVKSGENLRQIVSISAYIRVFYEYPSMKQQTGEMFNWEMTNNLMSITNVDRGAASEDVKMYQSTYVVMSVVSFGLYLVFMAYSIWEMYALSHMIFFGVFCVAYTALGCIALWVVLKTRDASSVKKNMMNNSKIFLKSYIQHAVDIEMLSPGEGKEAYDKLVTQNSIEVRFDRYEK